MNIKKIVVTPCASSYRTRGWLAPKMSIFHTFNLSTSTYEQYTLPTSTTPQELAATTWDNLEYSKIAGSKLELGVEHDSGIKGSKVSQFKIDIEYEY